MMTLKGRLKAVLLLGLLLPIGVMVGAEEAQPPRRVFTLPIEMDVDHGAANGDAVILRLMPLASFPMGERWRLINLTLAMVADAPGGVPGQPVALSVHAYANVIKPDGAPEWLIRVDFIVPIPKALRRG
jgi:hypothetical protein